MSSSEEEQVNTVQEVQEETKTQTKPLAQTQPVPSQTKKTASYTYWVDEKNKSRELPPQQRPQKIDPPTLVRQHQCNGSKKSDDGRSHWNTAGTWQHRKINISQIENQYSEAINQWLKEACPQAKIKKIQLKGECEVVFTRNKKALTYEIHGKVEFQKRLLTNKEEQTQIENEKQDNKNQSAKDSDSMSLSDDKSSGEESPKQPKKKSLGKGNSMTFEITELTDTGDREHKVKADTTEDKKWISGQSNKLLGLLEDILKGFK